jgi:ribosomal protein S18 acetylase RimI-like enzyme
MPAEPIIIRQLAEADAAAFREIRLAGLMESPTAFGSSHAAENNLSIVDFAAMIERNYLVGAFVRRELAGVVGFYQQAGEKVSHRGNVWGVYVDPKHRGNGIARRLREDVLAHARQVVTQVHLCVVTDNEAALSLYESLGFASYGTEPNALRVGSHFYDEHLMVWRTG